MTNMKDLPHIGRTYQHYKGGHYKLLLIGKDEETQDALAIYSALEGGQVWVRPLIDFQPPRFIEVTPSPNPYEIPSAKDARRIANLGHSHPLNTQ